jgi:hypothetical protein
MKLKKGSGYWRVNTFPIGGEFKRLPEDTIIREIITVYHPEKMSIAQFKSLKGCDRIVLLSNGDKAGISSNDMIIDAVCSVCHNTFDCIALDSDITNEEIGKYIRSFNFVCPDCKGG